MDTPDIIVIGAGSAGAVIAARLSEDRARRVRLVDAGQDIPPGDVPADIRSAFPAAYFNSNYFWPDLTISLQARTTAALPLAARHGWRIERHGHDRVTRIGN